MNDQPLRTTRPRRCAGPRRRRGVALLLALIAMVISATLAYSYLETQNTAVAIARNINEQATARYMADAGMEMLVDYIRKNPDKWREKRGNDPWFQSDPSFGDGTFHVEVEDGEDLDGDGLINTEGDTPEGDGDLTNNSDDPFTVTITATVRDPITGKTTTHTVRTVITPGAGSGGSGGGGGGTGDGLVGYWKLDQSAPATTAPDASGYSNDGNLTDLDPATDWVEGVYGNALDFTDTTGFLDIPDSDAIDLADAATLEAWIYIDSYKPFGGLFHKGDSTSFNDEAYSLQFWSGNRLRLIVHNDSYARHVEVGSTLSTDRWYHIAAGWGPDGMFIYVDGELEASNSTVISAFNSDADLNVGAQLPENYNGSYKNFPFDGKMDDIRIYNRALSAEEITAHMEGEGALAAQLVAYYDFEEYLPTPKLVAHWPLDDIGPGIAAQNKFDYGGNSTVIDTYHSSLGPYDEQEPGADALVAVNNSGNEKLTLYDKATLKGHAFIGPGGDPERGIATWGGSSITGLQAALDQAVPMNTPETPTGDPFDGKNEGSLEMWGAMTDTLSEDHYYKDLSLWDRSTLTIDGQVTLLLDKNLEIGNRAAIVLTEGSSLDLYVKGNVSIGGSVNSTEDGPEATGLRLYMLNGKTFMTYGSAAFHGCVDNPNGNVELWDSSTLYGRVRAKQVEGSCSIHIDQDARFSSGGGAGLLAEWYYNDGDPRKLDDIDWDTPDYSTVVENVNWPKATSEPFDENVPKDRFGLKASGQIDIPQSGEWTFATYSDDGSTLWIDGELVVDNDGLHSMRKRNGSITLTAGKHDIEMYFFERTGHQGMIAYWQGPGVSSEEIIPASQFTQSGGTTSDEYPVIASENVAERHGLYQGNPTGDHEGHVETDTAVYFDGDDYLLIDHDDAFLLDQGTISFWFNSGDLSGDHGLFSKDSSDFDEGGHIHVYTDGDELKVRLQSTDSSHEVSSGDVLSTNQWYHVVVTFGGRGLRLYLDGSEMDTDDYTGGLGTSSGGTGNAEPLVLGANTWGSGDLTHTPLSDYYEGYLDDVRIYDYGLDAGQVTNLYNGEDIGEPTGPGWIVVDTSGYTDDPLNMTIEDVDNAAWGEDAQDGPDDDSDRTYLEITGDNRVVSDAPATAIFEALTATDQFALEIDFVPANVTQDGPARIVSYSDDEYNRNFTYGQDDEMHTVRLRTTTTSNNGTPDINSGDLLEADERVHVAVLFKDDKVTLYRNESGSWKQFKTAEREGTFLDWVDTYHLIFANEHHADRPWHGKLYRVAIYDRADLSALSGGSLGGSGGYVIDYRK